MRIHSLILLVAVLSLAPPVAAQSPAPAAPTRADSLYEHAARLVREGRGDEGRAMVDSMLAAAEAGSAEFAEALYWQSALAASAADAERGYRRLVVEHPAARRTGDAMFNLAQLELARGDRPAALRQLERIDREQPPGMLRVRAAMLAARLHQEARDPVKACAALAAAREAIPEGSVELRNQIEFQASGCASVMAQQQEQQERAESAAARPPVAQAEPPQPSPPPQSTQSTQSTPEAPVRSEAARPAPAAATTSRAPASGGFSVQLAAYDTRAEAERFAARVAAAGHPARVWGTVKPFRVRVGRWATRAEATRQLQALRALSRDAYVVAAEADTR